MPLFSDPRPFARKLPVVFQQLTAIWDALWAQYGAFAVDHNDDGSHKREPYYATYYWTGSKFTLRAGSYGPWPVDLAVVSAGINTCTFTTPLSSANYTLQITGSVNPVDLHEVHPLPEVATRGAASFRVRIYENGALADPDTNAEIHVTVHRPG